MTPLSKSKPEVRQEPSSSPLRPSRKVMSAREGGSQAAVAGRLFLSVESARPTVVDGHLGRPMDFFNDQALDGAEALPMSTNSVKEDVEEEDYSVRRVKAAEKIAAATGSAARDRVRSSVDSRSALFVTGGATSGMDLEENEEDEGEEEEPPLGAIDVTRPGSEQLYKDFYAQDTPQREGRKRNR